jgi:hypothetical protein
VPRRCRKGDYRSVAVHGPGAWSFEPSAEGGSRTWEVHGELVLVDVVQQQHDWSAPADN